jgi:glycosyltransferase involved in cell wall biosynthesis
MTDQRPMGTPLLSVIIPARNEMWLARTVRDILGNAKGETECIVICDGSWPDPPLQDQPGLTVLHYVHPVGQRAAVNQGVRLSRAKYVMKLDGHSAVDEGFDVKLAAPYEDGRLSWRTTTIPRMFNLYVYDWECQGCKREVAAGKREEAWTTYQGARPVKCPKCGGAEFAMKEVWQPRRNRQTDFARFDSELHFQYWHRYNKRKNAQGDLADVMSSVGACFFMRRDWFKRIGGLDEGHGYWGQFGTEVSCKSWLSHEGRQVVNKTTWFSHYFRVGGAHFPYPISGNDQERARVYSRELWRSNGWSGQTRPLRWLVEKFWPVDGWTQEALEQLPTSLNGSKG